MALHGSFSGGGQKANRLSKMSSVPTTEDLRYALAECKKHNKPVELPFENNRNVFVIKVQHPSPQAPPRWTFSRGEGPDARVIWTRDTVEVLMIQNKIRTESAYDSTGAPPPDNATSGYQAPYVPEYEQSGEIEQYDQGYEQGYEQAQADQNYISSQQIPAASMGFGGAPGSGSPIITPSRPSPPTQPGGFGGGIPSKGFGGPAPDAATSQSMPAWNPQPAGQQAQAPTPSSIPSQGFSEQAASGRQAPFQPSGADPSSKVLMPPKLAGFDSMEFNAAMRAQGQQVSQPVQDQQPPAEVPNVDPVYQGNDKAGDTKKVAFDMSGIFGNQPPPPATTASAPPKPVEPAPAPSTPAAPAVPPPRKTPLPAPVTFDPNMIATAQAKMLDSRTGLLMFDSFLFFLFREFNRFEKAKSGFSFLICEVVLKQNNQRVPMPSEALAAIGQRLNSILTPADCAAYINGSDFAILVPYADPQTLTAFIEMVYRSLSGVPLLPNWPENSTVVAIGAASVPTTCDDVGVVVAAAQSAKEMAKGSSPAYAIYPN